MQHKKEHEHFPFHHWVPILGPSRSYILWKIFMLSEKEGFCWASQRTLSEMCGIPYGTFRKEFEWLKSNHFFRFHAPPIERKPLHISLSNKAFYPAKFNDAALPESTSCAPIEHSAALPVGADSYESNERTGGGYADAPPPAPTAEQPLTVETAAITEEQRQDPTFRFPDLEPEASQKLCDALRAYNDFFDVERSRRAWQTWLQEYHPDGFRDKFYCVSEEQHHVEPVIQVLQTFLPKKNVKHVPGRHKV